LNIIETQHDSNASIGTAAWPSPSADFMTGALQRAQRHPILHPESGILLDDKLVRPDNLEISSQ
jgi:hypothetical protein